MFHRLRSFWLLLCIGGALSLHASDACQSALSLSLNASLRGFGAFPTCFRIEPEVSGGLWLELQMPAFAPGGARLELQDCSPGDRGFRVRRRESDQLELEVYSAENLVVCVHPGQQPPSFEQYLLQSVFVPGLKIDAKGGRDREEDEPDPHPFWSRPSAAACGQLLRDDRPDTRQCAAPLQPGQKIQGAFDQQGWWDGDFFEVLALEPQTLVLELVGEEDLALTLYDAGGSRLVESEIGPEPGERWFVRTLEPGRYFVRIGGREGSYQLAVGLLTINP